MADLVVKLDANGHVSGVSTGPERDGWIIPPPEVAGQPFAHRYCAERGWLVKTPEECAAFDAHHALPDPPEHPSKAALRKILREGIGYDPVKQLIAIHAIADIIL